MKRYVVIQLYSLSQDESSGYGEEIVHDADSLEEADDWVNSQQYPESFVIEDGLEDLVSPVNHSDEDDYYYSRVEDNDEMYQGIGTDLYDDETDCD